MSDDIAFARPFVLRRDRDISDVVAVLGTEAARASLNQQIETLLRAAAFREQARYRPIRETVRVPEAIEVTGHLDRFAEAVMPVIDQLLAARDRAQKTAGRAYLLADRWEAAHGSANFLVRAAGVELREALDSACGASDGQPAPGRPASSCSNPDHACGACGDCAYEHPGEGGCPETPAHPAHIELVIQQAITADLRTENQALRAKADRLEPALFEQQRLADELGMSETAREQLNSERIEAAQLSHTFRNRAENAEAALARARDVASMWAPRLLPRSEAHLLLTDLRRALKGPTRNVAVAVEVRDPCPYCEGCPLIPRTLMDDHVREHHPEVHTVEPGAPVPPADAEVERARDLLLARFGADQADVVDRLISAVERRSCCDLPHEMEV
ncbi:hypothetical protein ACFWQ6_00945 [Streptomyces coelicoflavus]|uniref:hypothetical protein n=1 Tax=Streptomyces coelicoflavus TaxID=285562 RepID=UPI00364DC29B